jgi:hypothetical protein
MYSINYNSQITRSQTSVVMDIFPCFGMWNSCPQLSAPFSYTLYSIDDESIVK